ncbi:RsiV family protein [Paenibacillus flagellatus]|uniref:DUF3298 domain-containing protein n=1 Tax=Paenibacillus flagellatus TaxID=2211139 RepID=A0A2V5KCP1_9BACL|nr:RsiV family protein [Paenibacillus flagellatus]PYI57298.1 DUF3298 domain-containing protein [Paenibacillus flagellatus]
MEFRDLSAIVSKKVMIKPRLQIRYPQLSGLPNRKAQTAMNDRILDLTYGLIRDQGYVQDPTKEMTGGYETRLNGNGLISIVFRNDAYSKGAAHGLTVQRSLTMDLWNGNAYRFGDLFPEGSEYKDTIDAILKREIEEREVPVSDIADFRGVGPEQDYYLTPNELVVYYRLYEYTPYAFPIPYGDIVDIADPQGPIGRLQPVAI